MSNRLKYEEFVPFAPDDGEVLCWMYNAAKGAGTDKDVIIFAEKLCQINSLK